MYETIVFIYNTPVMARINDTSKYAYDSPSINDYVIGTDGDSTNKKTRNYKISDILQLFLDGSEIEGIDQNNKVIEIYLGRISVDNEEITVADAVNALPEFQIGEEENYAFTLTKEINSSATVNRPPELRIQTLRYLLKPGKGYYGTEVSNPTTEVEINDFYFIDKEEISLQGSTSLAPVAYYITNTAGQAAAAAINAAGTYAVIDGKDVYFQVSNDNGTGRVVLYRFIGSAGTYGIGGTQVVSGNLLSSEAIGIQTSGTTNIRFIESPPIYIPTGSSKSEVVNALPTFTVTQNEAYIFNFRQTYYGPGATPTAYILSSSYFLKRGKGIYGVGTGVPPLTESDFKLNFKESSQSTLGTLPVTYVILDGSDEADVVDAINASETAIVKDDDNSLIIEKDNVKYKFIGANGTYGDGNLQCDEDDIEELSENDSVFPDDIELGNVTIKDVLVLPPRTLPSSPVSGMIVNVSNTILFYNGTGWYTLDMTPYGV